MNRIVEHREAYRFNTWANQRVLQACRALSPEQADRDMKSSFPSVRRTLVHVLASEWIWLRRWKGESPTEMPAPWETLDLDEIGTALSQVDLERAGWLDGLAAADLDRVIEYRNTRGEPQRRPLWQLLRHVVNHSSYHRGQVTTMLRQLGAAATATDFVLFFSEP